jgi:hypothetical protein
LPDFIAKVEPVLTAGYVLGIVALHGQVIENGQIGASVFPGVDSVEADVELLAIGRVGEQGVDDLHTVEFQRVVLFASESISGLLRFGQAAGSTSGGRPFADSGVLVELKLSVANVCLVDAIDAQVEAIADGWVFMGEDAVLTRALNGGRGGRLKLQAIAAVHVERIVAFLSSTASIVEH